MRLTTENLGDTFVWVDIKTRFVELVGFNPADDSEVQVRPESGGKLWVPVANLLPEGQLVRDSVVEELRNRQARVECHVRELIDALAKERDRSAPFWTAVEKLQLDLDYRMGDSLAIEPDPVDLQDDARGDFTPGSDH